jgi:hypothetical protein
MSAQITLHSETTTTSVEVRKVAFASFIGTLCLAPVKPTGTTPSASPSQDGADESRHTVSPSANDRMEGHAPIAAGTARA